MLFGMSMFLFAMLFQGNDGLFPWQRGLDTEGRINHAYEDCGDTSSSISLLFFNINTNQIKFRECLKEAARNYVSHTEQTVNAFDIPTEFRDIILNERLYLIAEAKNQLEVKIANNPSTITQEKVVDIVNSWIFSNTPQPTKPRYNYGLLPWQRGFEPGRVFAWDSEEAWRHEGASPTWDHLCVLSPIEKAIYNGDYWIFGGSERGNERAEGLAEYIYTGEIEYRYFWDIFKGKYYEETDHLYFDIDPRCGIKRTLSLPDTQTSTSR